MIVFVVMITKYDSKRNITFDTNVQHYIQPFKRFVRNHNISREYYKFGLLYIQDLIHTIQCYLRIDLIIIFIMDIRKLYYFKCSILIEFQCLFLSPYCKNIQ